MAVNEELPEKIEELSTEERRARIRKILNLLGGEAGIINVTKMADTFGVTREAIYKDIEKLGFER